MLDGGDPYYQTTAAALDGAKAVVVLWSKTSVNSHWVHDEATRGRDRHCIVPTSIDGVAPPLGFGQFQTVDLSKAKLKSSDPSIQSLLNGIALLHDQPAVPNKQESEDHSGFGRRAVLAGGAAALTMGGGLALWQFGLSDSSAGKTSSVVVIPFRNLSGDAAQDYFSDGLSEEVRTTLAQNELLKVVGQASAKALTDGDFDAKEIAAKLDVMFVLSGSVRRSSSTLRIAARLIDGKTGADSWTQTFDRAASDVLAVQSEIAKKVANALTAQVAERTADSKPGSRDQRKGGTADVAAYDAYLRGQSLFLYGVTEEEERAAIIKYEEAISIDQNYAAAHAARARALTYIAGRYGKADELVAINRLALAAAQQAVRIAPEMGEGHSALGYVLFYGFLETKRARSAFGKAMQLAPGEEVINAHYARFCALSGQKSAAQISVNQAVALSPLDPNVYRLLGGVHFWARRYDAAIPAFKKALTMSPGMALANGFIANALHLMGKLDEALTYYQLEPNSTAQLPGLAILEHQRGNAKASQAAMTSLIEKYGEAGLYQKGQILAQTGDIEGALSALEKALSLHDSGMVYLLTDPFLDPVRKDPRFSRLLVATGFA